MLALHPPLLTMGRNKEESFKSRLKRLKSRDGIHFSDRERKTILNEEGSLTKGFASSCQGPRVVPGLLLVKQPVESSSLEETVTVLMAFQILELV